LPKPSSRIAAVDASGLVAARAISGES